MADVLGDPEMGSVEALGCLARTRDARAWARLLELHGADIMRTARSVLLDRDLAEDACQETLLRIRDHAGRFQAASSNPEGSAQRWIRRLACRTALNIRRARRRAFRRDDTFANSQAEDQGTTPAVDSAGRKAEILGIVRRELARLPEHERLPIQLRFFGEMAYTEVATALDCRVGTAKMRAHRGLERMRRRLGMMGIFLGSGQLSALLVAAGTSVSRASLETTPALAARWGVLLECPRKPTNDVCMERGGSSIMLKLGLGALASLVIGFAFFNGKQAPVTVSAKAPGPLAPTSFAAGLPTTEPAPAEPRGDKPAPVSKATKVEQQAVVRGNNAFAVDLYARLRAEDGNLFLSPYSISTALAMTYAGARGNTAAQMTKVLRFNLKPDRLHPTFAALLGAQNEAPAGRKRGYQLSVANALWGQKGYGFLKDFLDLTRAHYGAGLTELDFGRDPEGSRKTINAWVEKETREKIKDLLKERMIDGSTRLVLTNAIHFKGDWASKFDKKATEDASFKCSATEEVKVPMMHQTGQFRYAAFRQAGGFCVLELPYVGKELSMFVLLPDRLGGLAKLENELNGGNVERWLEIPRAREVKVFLPRFKITAEFMLNEKLKAMGMTDAFGSADFSGMTGHKGLYISAVVHKAFVDVNEEGTEAAAATAVVMDESKPPPPPVFRADRPFVFLIRDNRSKSILFVGRLSDPR